MHIRQGAGFPVCTESENRRSGSRKHSIHVNFLGIPCALLWHRHGFLKPPRWDRQGIGHVTTRHRHQGRSSPNSTSFTGACSSLYDVQRAIGAASAVWRRYGGPPMWLIATGTVSASRSLTCPAQTLRASSYPLMYTRGSQWGPQWGRRFPLRVDRHRKGKAYRYDMRSPL